MDDFGQALLEVIDEILKYTLGDIGARAIYSYIERTGCPKQEKPQPTRITSNPLKHSKPKVFQCKKRNYGFS